MQMRLMDTMRACCCCSPDLPPPLPLVIHGKDVSAPARGEYAGYVFKSQDDGDSWTTETGDIVTMAVNSGVWSRCTKISTLPRRARASWRSATSTRDRVNCW